MKMTITARRSSGSRLKIWLLIALLVLVAITAVRAALMHRSRQTKKVAPRMGPIVEAVYGLGTVMAQNRFDFRIGTTNHLIKHMIAEGDLVKDGQSLAILSDGVHIKAPFSGTVVQFPYRKGENIFPNTTIVRIEDFSSLYLEASIDQRGALRITRDLPVTVTFENIRGSRFKGVVRSIYAQSGQFLVHIAVDSLPPQVLPGMTADVAIEVARREKALLIPALAIQAGQVLVERQGRRQRIQVEVGSIDGEWAEILSGELQPDDLVYMKGR